MIRVGILLSFLMVFCSCLKEDDAIVLPLPGDEKQLMANMNTDYATQVYVSLTNNSVYTANSKSFDIAFEASESGRMIYLNSAMYMFGTSTNSYDILTADTVGAKWKIDDEELNPDSLVFKKWNLNLNGNNASKVYIIDRGQNDFSGPSRFRKIQIIASNDLMYKILVAPLNNSSVDTIVVNKDSNYSLMYLDFDTPNTLVSVSPPKTDWDFVFTKYTHEYFDQPINSIYRFYPVAGVMQNVWTNTKALEMEKDSTPNYIPFENFNFSNTTNNYFSIDANIVGFDWKYYDFSQAKYIVYPNLYFVLQCNDGFYYKLRMLDFYDMNGNKGNITLQYQRI